MNLDKQLITTMQLSLAIILWGYVHNKKVYNSRFPTLLVVFESPNIQNGEY